ncbi:hypothetical protein [Undibacterium sp. Xuan67W]|uniref:hypothetical protein n=1 Tax=Undibacterium sp. Xuan67W TaxID=3413057 RepID=UPI003BF32331
MNALLYPFMLLSAFGLLLSIASHLSALAGIPIPGGHLVWSLHAGIFVVWLPTVLVANRMSCHGKRSDFWKLALSGCPVWARYMLCGLFGYAVINFIFCMNNMPGHPGGLNASNDGTEVRLFSGHWMVFYAVAFATLYSAINNPHLLKSRKCAHGHEVAPFDQFCPTCGAVLAPDHPKI